MKLYLENFKKYRKIVENFIECGHHIRESFYLDFENSLAYFFSSNGYGKFPFVFEGENPNNFFVHAKSLLNLSQYYNELLYENNEFYSESKKDSFKLNTFTSEPNIDNDDNIKNSVNISFHEYITKGIKFCDTDESSPFNGVFIRNDRIVSGTTIHFYEKLIDTGIEINLPFSFMKIINLFDEDYKVADLDSKLIFKYKELCLHISKNNNLNMIDTSSQEFQAEYNHESYIKVDYNKFKNTISFLSSFIDDVINSAVNFVINDDVKFIIKSENVISKSFECESIDEKLKGYDFWFSLNEMKKIIASLETDILTIKINPEKIAIDFSGEDETEHYIMAKMKN